MSNSAKKLTIKDIAQLAGVSIGTVDRAIHNRGEVSEKTRAKILKITKALNFKPDVLASTLASKKNIKFAVVMPAADSESSFWKAPNIGIDNAINEIGHYGVSISKYLYSIVDRNSFLDEGYKAVNDRPDGIILAPSFQNEALEIAKLCLKNKIPYSFFNSTIANLDQICYVGQDACQSGQVAAKLLDYGLDKNSQVLVVSIFGFLKNNKHILDRKSGFLNYFKGEKSRKIETLDIDSLNIKDVNEALRNYFTAHPGIKGIFVTNSRVFYVAKFLESVNYKNIKLIGYDLTSENIPYLKKDIINFLINQKPVEQLYRAVISLFNKIILKKDVPKEILLPIDIVTKENLKYYEEY